MLLNLQRCSSKAASAEEAIKKELYSKWANKQNYFVTPAFSDFTCNLVSLIKLTAGLEA